MERATGGFSKRNIIGEGGFAIVYKTIGPLLPFPPSYPPLCSSKISMAQTMSALVCNNFTTHAIDENVLMFIALLAHLTIAYDIHAKTVECIHALRCTIAVALAQVAKNA
uniref:Protein kinase domain-containing protein n=1 Tax=Oryza glumipatula TaxID=40148 RepID=A0A0D9Z956_9ORYZ